MTSLTNTPPGYLRLSARRRTVRALWTDGPADDNVEVDGLGDWPVEIIGDPDENGYVPVILEDGDGIHLVHPMFLRLSEER